MLLQGQYALNEVLFALSNLLVRNQILLEQNNAALKHIEQLDVKIQVLYQQLLKTKSKDDEDDIDVCVSFDPDVDFNI